jgi:alkanesulfonate monooxygenase SsuD/methylene tetrahydromethanopterin reductase-like flavin-dependent oxidoreductase (luciferase family)
MILDIFSEMQKPEGMPEPQVYAEALEQAKLADQSGFGCWWSVEHHGTGEFSYCSTPDLMLTAISQHTEQIHLGHSGVLAPFGIHHPMQIAERAAFLDILSGGRLELGLARSLPREWENFGVDPDETREQVDEAIRMIPRMWREGRFSYQGKYLTIPERDVIPKPFPGPRRSGGPHPPIWVTSAGPEGFERAGRFGVGILATAMLSTIDQLTELFEHYQRGLDQCEPVGAFVNDQRAVFTFFHCAETRQEAIESGIGEAVLWFMNAQPEVYSIPRDVWLDLIRDKAPVLSEQERTDRIVEWAEAAKLLKPGDSLPAHPVDLDDPVPVIRLLNRQRAGQELDPVEVFEALEPLDAVIIGDVDTCRHKLERYAECGVDRLMCLMQMAPMRHDMVMRSIRTAGKYLVPQLAAFQRSSASRGGPSS